MKLAGEFVKPNGMTNHSKRPSFNLKATFSIHISALLGHDGSHKSDQSY